MSEPLISIIIIHFDGRGILNNQSAREDLLGSVFIVMRVGKDKCTLPLDRHAELRRRSSILRGDRSLAGNRAADGAIVIVGRVEREV